MGNYMEHDIVGKIMAVHTVELRTRPDFNLGDVDDAMIADWRRRPRLTRRICTPSSMACRRQPGGT